MESLASLAVKLNVDILDLIRSARQLELPGWIDERQAEDLARHISSKYSLTDKEIEDVEDFLLTDQRARELFGQFVGLEHIITSDESTQVLEAISRRILQTLGPKYGQRLRQQDLTRIVLNLGVLDVYRSGSCINNTEHFVESVVAPYSRRLGESILTRSYYNKMQTMTIEEARGFLERTRQKWLGDKPAGTDGGTP